jgi:hypothetical protein
MPVQWLKVAVLPLDLTCSGPVTHSGEILTTGKSHRKKPDRHGCEKKGDIILSKKSGFLNFDLGKDLQPGCFLPLGCASVRSFVHKFHVVRKKIE